MTTFEPGARVVLTHGLRVSPRSTAFLATSAAPIITDGFDVLVQEVIAAITTAPWSSSKLDPSSNVTGTRLRARPASAAPDRSPAGGAEWLSPACEGGSLAGKDSAEASSYPTSSSAAALDGWAVVT